MARSRPSKTYRIAVSMAIDSSPRRSILAGFLSAASQHDDWDIRILPPEEGFSCEDVPRLVETQTDGLILGSVKDAETASALARAPFKTLALESYEPATPTPAGRLVYFDNTKTENMTGRFGFDRLRSAGNFRHFAFVPFPASASWSTNRRDGFVRAACEAKVSHSVCPANANDPRALTDWLDTLPKPVAIMAACDRLGVQVLEACRSVGIASPDTLCVLGVDNDTLLNEHCRPTLSSISLDHEGLGAIIADGLYRNLKSRKTARNLPLPAKTLRFIERDSTRPPVPAAQLLRKALDYIRDNADKGITAEDVVRHLGVSRRLAFLRFSQLSGQSIATTIREERLKLVRQKLMTTDLSLQTIARSSGFASQRPLERLFLKCFGCPMRVYRARAGN